MVTRYTAIVGEKDDVSLRDFTLRCARRMGALVIMGDQPLDKKIPEEFVPSSYHSESLEKARTELGKAIQKCLDGGDTSNKKLNEIGAKIGEKYPLSLVSLAELPIKDVSVFGKKHS